MKANKIVNTWRKFLTEGEIQKSSIKVFLDMDGVLVDFEQGLIDVINRDLVSDEVFSGSRSKKIKKLRQYEGLDKVFPLTNEFMASLLVKRDTRAEMTEWEKLVKRYQFNPIVKNFDHWFNLQKAEGCDELVKGCIDLLGLQNVYILSAPVDSISADAKRAWLEKHLPLFPSERIFIRKDKEAIPVMDMFQQSQCILIDDREKYKLKFEAVGGVGIIHSPPTSLEGTFNSLKQIQRII
jgi:5'(3')-deoxyribonucleotidase